MEIRKKKRGELPSEPTRSPRSMGGQCVASSSYGQIARRAYGLFLARGAEHGHAEEDWLKAEHEMRLGRK